MECKKIYLLTKALHFAGRPIIVANDESTDCQFRVKVE